MQRKITSMLFALLFCAAGFAQNSQDSASFSDYTHGILELQSLAPAAVWLNGQAVGNTPFSMEMPAGWAVYALRAPGYWTEVYLANFNKGVKISHNVQMKKHGAMAKEIPNVLHINDLRILESIYDNLAKQDSAVIPDSVCIAHFAADYPLPLSAPEPLSDSSAEYRSYFETYLNERQLSFNEWHASCSGSMMQQNADAIFARMSELGSEQLNGFVPVVAAGFESTALNGLKGNLELYFYSPDGRAEVAWKGAWEHDFLTGNELVVALTASTPVALAFLTTPNHVVWIPVENGYSRRYYKYSELNISWNGLLIPMKGEFILPDYIRVQPEVAKWLSREQFMPQELAVPDKIIEDSELVKIPGGRFKYKGKETEIEPFAMNASAINQELYNAKCGKKNFGKYKGNLLPAHSVTWKEANGCCALLGGNLPTEAQWEYAARAGSPYPYAWALGINAKDYAVFGEKKPLDTRSRKPNGWGLYDMFGNVAEWVKDDGFWFGKYKFLKGGSYKSDEVNLNVENSEEEDARYWGTHVGFRCVFEN